MSFWKNDNYFVGLTIGLILTIFTSLLLMVAVPIIYNMAGWSNPTVKILLLAIVPGIIMMRYYMRVLKFAKSGAGVLTTVFISIILYFAFIAEKVELFPQLIK